MNYRHAFHAGNFADCVKHALLLALLDLLARKPAPFFVLDTHAGRGGYDLLAEADRTGEWRDGIARLLARPAAALAEYVRLAEGLGLYPGSPAFIRARLRPGDGLACCELHPEDAAALRRRFRDDPQVSVHCRDGYEAIRALLPPQQRRGLVLIDPPYEQAGEFARVVAGFVQGAARFGHAVYAAWYPIKHRSPVTEFHEAVRLAGLRDVVAAELWLRESTDPGRLNGCGMLVRNAPYGFEPAARGILEALGGALGEFGGGCAFVRVADE